MVHESEGEDDEAKKIWLQISPVFKLVTEKGLQSSLFSSLTITLLVQVLRVCVLVDMKPLSL